MHEFNDCGILNWTECAAAADRLMRGRRREDRHENCRPAEYVPTRDSFKWAWIIQNPSFNF
jgi:hypothetical protein